ncbi:radical SAM protein [Chondromyces crocatus]|uniref:Radical SAM core domain-containing protein n=1 Tax=Chondromyces crocatus TaxID=52 RepID=A0A0K1EJF0_CHOCO|nr:radical SAM protein [Chondromyces crocatus]AKT40989.1 uncharacterized protein CMC5_051460 [Chondromyces crocatus]
MIETIVLHYTDRCNIECAHCCVSSGPKRTTKFEPAAARDLIQQAAALGIGAVKFTGGESLLFPEEILELTRLAGSLGLEVGVVTNGFWAPTVEAGKAFLEPFVASGLRELDVSVDVWHWKFLDPGQVGHAIAAARSFPELLVRMYRVLKADESPTDPAFYAAYGLDLEALRFESCNANDMLRRRLDGAANGVTVRWTYASRIGRAKSLPLADTRTVPVAEVAPARCTEVTMAPIAYPDGTLYACCSGKVPRPLVAGNLRETSLAELQGRMERNALLQFIATFSPKELHDALVARGVELPKNCDSVCHICKSALSKVDDALLQEVATEEWNRNVLSQLLGSEILHG